MQEITETTTTDIKEYETGSDEHCLVHDDTEVITLAGPGSRTGTPAENTMQVGAKQELLDYIDEEGLEYEESYEVQ